MATKKSVGTMQQHRSMEGVLEMEKNKGLKKKWKSYGFKVSASTYLLCFKTDVTNPEKTMLLADVIKVVPAACHGAAFPFEVHFRGRGSPWRLNAGSNEERMGWMDVILPGSSSSVAHFRRETPTFHTPTTSPPPYTHTDEATPTRHTSLGNHASSVAHFRRETPTFHTPTASPPPTDEATPTRHTSLGNHASSLGSDPRQHANPNPYTEIPKPTSHTQPTLSNDGDDDDTFLEASLAPPTTSPAPQEYLLPSEGVKRRKNSEPKSHTPPKHSASDGEFAKPSPRPRARSRIPRPSPAPRSPARPSAAEGDDDYISMISSEGDDDYISMISSPAKRKLQMTVSEGELPQYLEVVADCTTDEDNYVIPDPPETPTNSLRSLGGGVESSEGAGSGGGAEGAESGPGSGSLVDTIAKHFNRDQISMLIEMLQNVRMGPPQTAQEQRDAWQITSPSSPSTGRDSEEDSIRGHLSRALSYAPNLSEGILVTEEDSEESYEKRPEWAKAVAANGQTNAHSEQLDTLTNLQEEALYISRTDIKNLAVIGQGQFGEVYRGVLERGAEAMPVAVKMTKETISEYLQQSFLKEMSIMSQMMHPNIVRLYGIVTQNVPSPWIVLEYMEHGDLKHFLTKNKRSVQQLVKYMFDVAMGMHYISERGLVHRDLAARNVLVGANEICKVADFGLLREIPQDLAVYTASHSIPCPIRWMPPESMSDRQFSAASDVWSFGVLVWEMFNPTRLPFDKYDNMGVVSKVNEGLRLPIPRGAPSIVAKIMKACWHRNPNKRPSFLVISTLLSTRTLF